MLITSNMVMTYINYKQPVVNAIQQAVSLVNKRSLRTYISLVHSIKSALKRHVWGVYATYIACLILIINSL